MPPRHVWAELSADEASAVRSLKQKREEEGVSSDSLLLLAQCVIVCKGDLEKGMKRLRKLDEV